jgi:UDP:flavonoid glycosyltransferase YjiC (YdhE family)
VLILFTCVPGYGHLHPMLPLAFALRSAGHEVMFSTGGTLRERVVSFGFRCYPAGPDVDQMQANAFESRPALRDLAHVEPWRVAAAIFAGRVGPTLAQLEDVRFKPDVVVHDAYELTGPVLAARHGAPWVTHGLGPRWPECSEVAAAEDLHHVWAGEGFVPPPRAGLGRFLYLEPCPSELRSDDSVTSDPIGEIRPVPVAEHSSFRGPFFKDTKRWRVYATLGTVTNSRPEVFRGMLDAFDRGDYEVLLTVGSSVDVESLGSIPANVDLKTYVPQADVLGRCDAVVCHGGSGTVLAAYSQGLPVVIVPQGTDQFRNAPFYAQSGAAIILQPNEFGPETLRGALEQILTTTRYREAAQRLRASISEMPPAECYVERLEELVLGW